MTGVDKARKPAGQPSHYLAVTEKLRAAFYFFPHADPLISLLEECHDCAMRKAWCVLVSTICWHGKKMCARVMKSEER